jgi:outer membrane lipoprotein-sorting protein
MNVTKSFDLSFDPVMRMMSEQLSALTSGKFDAIGNLYDVSEPKDGRRTLLPKSPEIKKLFKEMQVTVDAGGAVTEVLLVSANGDTTSISFQNTILNPKLDDALFEEPKSR